MSFLRRQALPLVALFAALGGTTYAATSFPAHSIGAKQLKRDAVTRPKLAADAVTGAKVAADALRGSDFRESAFGEVPSAAHAETAAKAGHAATAANAAHAGVALTSPHADDADKLGGAAATAYESRVTGTCGLYRAIGSISPGNVSCGGPIDRLSDSVAAGHSITFGGNEIDVDVLCHTTVSDTVWLGIKNVTSSPARYGYFYETNGGYAYGSDIYAANGGVATFSFKGNRIEGQFIIATTDGVTTLKVHALDTGSRCDVQMARLFAS